MGRRSEKRNLTRMSSSYLVSRATRGQGNPVIKLASWEKLSIRTRSALTHPRAIDGSSKYHSSDPTKNQKSKTHAIATRDITRQTPHANYLYHMRVTYSRFQGRVENWDKYRAQPQASKLWSRSRRWRHVQMVRWQRAHRQTSQGKCPPSGHHSTLADVVEPYAWMRKRTDRKIWSHHWHRDTRRKWL